MVRNVVARLVAGAVADALALRGLAPKLLGHALLHNPAHLAAGGIAFNANGQVPKAFTAKELESLLGQNGGAALDVLLLGKVGGGVILHIVVSFCVPVLYTPFA